MFRELVSRNPDLERLVEKGYAVAFDSNHLVVRDIPYVDQAGSLAWGAIVTKLEFIDTERVQQEQRGGRSDHQVFFAGGVPHRLDGSPIRNLGGGPTTLALSHASRDVIVQRSFSNKPRSGRFNDFFDKIESYVTIISGPAMERFGVSPLTRRVVMDDVDASVFKFPDTLTSALGLPSCPAGWLRTSSRSLGLVEPGRTCWTSWSRHR